jgi:two-component system, NtrC family, sensor kinase
MKTIVIGGGKGCRAILELAVEGRLKTLSLDVLCVVDPDDNAPGIVYARENNIPTFNEIKPAVRIPGLELILEVTGSDKVLDEIHKLHPPAVRVVDHVLARVFWDVEQAEIRLRRQLKKSIGLEKQLDQDRKHLQEILDAMPQVVVVINKDGAIESVNAGFETMTGISREDAIGMRCKDAHCKRRTDAECGHEDPCSFAQVLKTGNPVSLIRHWPGNGNEEEQYWEVTANPLRDESGEITKIVETTRAITDQVKLKRDTEENEHRFRQFLEGSYDLIVMKDTGGRYLFINHEAAEMMGKTPEDFLGRTDPDVLPGKLARRIMNKDREVMESKDHVATIDRIVIKDREYYLDSVRFPLLDYKGDIAGVASISRDISEEKKLQRELVQSERLAAVGKLAAGVAHEINNPLTGILTFTESLLLDTDPDDPVREDYEIIIHETMRCRQIVKDLLDYARLEKPKRELSDLNSLVERALSLVSKQAEFQDIQFLKSFAPDVPMVSVDPNQIQQVVLNLVINAKDAMNKSGRIEIVTSRPGQNNKAMLQVKDQGCGIAPDKIKNIFEPFYTTKGTEGNGLGLPVVSSIIAQHDGKIDVESEAGTGTTFTITIPGVSEGV